MGFWASVLSSSLTGSGSVGLISAIVCTCVAALADGARGVVSVALELVCGS